MNLRGRLKNWYAWGAAGVLGVSTLAWSLVIARQQLGNADQLADGFLFTDWRTFHQAQFPAAHTQLFKWPLFWLLGALHNATSAYMASTVVLSLVTVGGLAYGLYKIVRRPALLATLYLGLACVLTLVPAQVLGNVSSPLSLAMVTGRNLEYLLYIGVLLLLLPSARKYEWQRWSLAALLLGLLVASDQLFLVLSLGGAAALLLCAYSWSRRALVNLGWVWLAVSSAGWVLSRLLFWGFEQITTIADGATNFAVLHLAAVHSATTYGVKGVLLNFGITARAGHLAIVPAILNTLLLGLAVCAAYVVSRRALHSAALPNRATTLVLLLGLSTIAAFVAFVATNHPAAADARYLTISLFVGFVALAAHGRTLRLNQELLYGCSGLLLLGALLGLIATVHHTNQTMASDPLRVRNQQVAQALAKHNVEVLVGDFWRILPIREDTKQAAQPILPLTGCLQPRLSLASLAWQHDLYNHSFAYLLPLQSGAIPFGRCSVQTMVFTYGRPTSVVRISGSAHNPTELLLFYNDGASRRHGIDTAPFTPVFGVPTEGTAKPTGSTMVPLADPS